MAIPIGLPSPQSCRGPPFAASSYSLCFLDGICGPSKVKTDIYMTLPRATTILNIDPSKQLLKLQQNLYGLKDEQVTWHEHIKKGLKERGFMVLFILYTDDATFFSPSAQAIDDEITSLKKAFNQTNEGELQDYLGTRFICHTNGQMELQQQKSIDNCLRLLDRIPTTKSLVSP